MRLEWQVAPLVAVGWTTELYLGRPRHNPSVGLERLIHCSCTQEMNDIERPLSCLILDERCRALLIEVRSPLL